MESKIQVQNKIKNAFLRFSKKNFKIVPKEEFKKFVKKYPESIIAKFSDEYDKSKIQYKILSN